ncbi:hypothetical protein [Methanosarcina sp.]|uniref:hypothetical protein n=1 Tax=Methanosarcina sp. TaxID=2213 RepID=UPI002ABBAA1E|nr:hypothetical protein [Methanosarcina sp.]MDY9926579.1 hypothetical protein [Methanosarcina sp.]
MVVTLGIWMLKKPTGVMRELQEGRAEGQSRGLRKVEQKNRKSGFRNFRTED